MKKTVLLIIALATSFCFGFAFRAATAKGDDGAGTKKVTGIGGLFFKCKDPKKLREWYAANLGLAVNQYGTVFEWYQGADSTKKGFTQWSPFKETTKYFEPSTKDFMINYRVEHIESLIDGLRKAGVKITDTIEATSYGKFIHILDPENNKLGLWEPNDVEYEKIGLQMGAKTTK